MLTLKFFHDIIYKYSTLFVIMQSGYLYCSAVLSGARPVVIENNLSTRRTLIGLNYNLYN